MPKYSIFYKFLVSNSVSSRICKFYYQKGPVPIYLRITVESKRSEFATGRECEPSRWNAVAGRVIGPMEAVKSTNAYLGNLEQQLFDAQATLVRDNALITAETIKNKFLGVCSKQRL